MSEPRWESTGWGGTDLAMGEDFLLPRARLVPGEPGGGGTAGILLPWGSSGAKAQPSVVTEKVQETLRLGLGGIRNRERHLKPSLHCDPHA